MIGRTHGFEKRWIYVSKSDFCAIQLGIVLSIQVMKLNFSISISTYMRVDGRIFYELLTWPL